MITCFIRYEIDPYRADAFERYAHAWSQAIPRCGADLAAYEAYRARLRDDPLAAENFAFATRERFIRREDRIFLRAIT